MKESCWRANRLWPLIFLVLLLVLAGVWQWSPLHRRLSLPVLEAWGRRLQNEKFLPLFVALAYTIAGLLSFPHGLMIWATGFLFPPLVAIAYAEMGSLCSGMATYLVGRTLSQKVIERLAGSRLDQWRKGFSRNAVTSIITLHIFPVMPYSVLNLVAGSSGVRMKDFLAGTIIGVTPGIIVVCFFGHQLLSILHHPNWKDVVLLVVFAAVGIVFLRILKKQLQPKRTRSAA